MNGQKRTEAALACGTGTSGEKDTMLAASVASDKIYPKLIPATSMMASQEWTWCIYDDNLPTEKQKQISRMATEAQKKSSGITFVDIATQAAKDMQKERVLLITPANYYQTNEKKAGREKKPDVISKDSNAVGLRVIDRIIGRPDKRKDHPLRKTIEEQRARYKYESRPANVETLFALHKETLIRLVGEKNVCEADDFKQLDNLKERGLDEEEIKEKRHEKIGTCKRQRGVQKYTGHDSYHDMKQITDYILCNKHQTKSKISKGL